MSAAGTTTGNATERRNLSISNMDKALTKRAGIGPDSSCESNAALSRVAATQGIRALVLISYMLKFFAVIYLDGHESEQGSVAV